MAERGYQFLPVKCATCGESLLRITQSETNDTVFCPNCLVSGDYKEVIEKGHGLTNARMVSKELADFIQQKWVARKLGRE